MSDLVVHQPREQLPIAYVGLPARADLLPQEIRDRVAMRAGRRLALLVLLLAVVIVAGAYALGWTLSLSSGLQLAAAQSRTIQLNVQQEGYQSVRDAQNVVSVAEAAVRVGQSTAVDWVPLVARVVAGLPSGASAEIGIVVQSPVSSVPPRSTPLAQPRIGDLQVTVKGPDLDALTRWLDQLAADPMISAVEVTTATEDGGWTVAVVVSVSPALTALEPEGAEG